MICFVDYRTTEEEINNLKSLNLIAIKVPKTDLVYEAINGHVDIQLNVLNKDLKHIIIHRDMDDNFKNILKENNISFITSKNSLSNKYPKNILLNGLILQDYFIHNTNYTDPNLLESQKEKTIIKVKQGYTKCSILPLKENVFITSDKGIFDSLKNKNFDILFLPPGDILLPPFEYGFIGGTGGMISKDTLALFGNLDNYLYGDQVKAFLKKHKLKYVPLKKGKLSDRGSILCV